MYERILVPLDGSELAEQILRHVEALAGRFGSSVTLLRAIPPLDAFIMSTSAAPIMGQPIAPYPVTDPAELADAERAEATAYLQKVAQRLGKGGFEVKHAEPDGAAADVIIRWAQAPGADLIAMTTHGRSGLGRLVMGSVADEVLHKTPCPVLLVRTSEESAPKET